MPNNIKVSIIIPIFNIEDYLKECLDSVVTQTYKNIEIILIDDGSTDSSGSIADEYAKRDKRVIVVHKKNGGLSDARNTGVKIASGKYLTFIDSDDYVHGALIKTALSKAEKTSSDIVEYTYEKVHSNAPHLNSSPNNNAAQFTTDGVAAMWKLFKNTKEKTPPFVVAWNKLYNADFFRKTNIVFPIKRIYEDQATTYKILCSANKYTYIPQTFYYYRQRKNSIMQDDKNLANMDSIKNLKEINDFVHPIIKNRKEEKIINNYNVAVLTKKLSQLKTIGKTDKSLTKALKAIPPKKLSPKYIIKRSIFLWH